MKVNQNERIRWEEQFPSVYGEKKYTGNNARNTDMAIKELKKYSLSQIRQEAKKLKIAYYITQNQFNDKWGLDKNPSHEGGGVVAQANSYSQCVKRAQDEFGIHPIFIIGVGIEGW